MKRRLLTLVAALSLLLLGGGLGYRLVVAGLISPETAPAAPCVPSKDKGDLCNPDAGLSDAEREARYAQLRSEGEQRYTAWLNGLDLTKLDLHSLPRGELNALYVPGQPSLREAVARADLIVVGSVTEFRPNLLSGTQTTFSVDRTVKGSPVSIVTVTQAGGLEPTQDFTGVIIAEGGNGAMLLPGDRAVLLLEKDKEGTSYIQSVSGWYQVVGGLVQSNAGNTWGDSVNGQTEAAFVQQLQAALQ